MPWILRGLFLVARTKRGRELLFAGVLAALDVAQSRRARRLYRQIGGALTDPRPRAFAVDVGRSVKRKIIR